MEHLCRFLIARIINKASSDIISCCLGLSKLHHPQRTLPVHSTASAGHRFSPAALPSLLSVGKIPLLFCYLCGNQSLSSSVCLFGEKADPSTALLQQQVLMPPEPCPRRGWEGTSAGTRLSKHPQCSCKGYLAPEHGCLSLPPHKRIAHQKCYAITLSSKSFTPRPFARREGIGKKSLRQDMGMLSPAETAPAWRGPPESPVTRFPLTWIRF